MSNKGGVVHLTRFDKYWGKPAGDRRPRVRLPARCRDRADRGQARRARHRARADPSALAGAGECAGHRVDVSSARARAAAAALLRVQRRARAARRSARSPRAVAARSIAARSPCACSPASTRPGAVADLARRSGRRPRGRRFPISIRRPPASSSTRPAGSTPTRTAFATATASSCGSCMIGTEHAAAKDRSGPPIKTERDYVRRSGAPRGRRHRRQDRRRSFLDKRHERRHRGICRGRVGRHGRWPTRRRSSPARIRARRSRASIARSTRWAPRGIPASARSSPRSSPRRSPRPGRSPASSRTRRRGSSHKRVDERPRVGRLDRSRAARLRRESTLIEDP